VVIADRASRMPLYEKIIKDLDQPSKVIEINAAIIEMNTNANLTWGVDYRSLNEETLETNAQGEPSTTGTFRLGQNTNADLADGVDLISGSGLNASAALIGTTWQILARIKALEEAGEAQVLSRPSVMTIDNTEAVLRDDSTIYVRVAGLAEVDLFPVSAGVMLRVTPHLIEPTKTNEPTKIRLIVNIEDGDFTPQNVDEIPSVRRSEISTQAIIAENESLLIGGQYRHQQSNGEVGVPVAGRVPVLGLAFKNKRVINNKRQRLFLISPRIIDPDEYYRRAESISARIMSAPPLESTDPVKTPTDTTPVFATEGDVSSPQRGTSPDFSAPMTRATPVSEEEPAFENGPAKPSGNLFQRLFTPTRTP
jgi:type III secretion protein C